MKLIVGLGNPGEKYVNNRHNVGHMFIDFLNDKKITSVKAVKTDCFMNVSGAFVSRVLAKNGGDTQDLFIVHDDLDIPFGMFKVQRGRGPKVHNGITSVEEKLGTADFWRVRVGVEARLRQDSGGPRPSGEEYVLADFTQDERAMLNEVFPKIYSRITNGPL